MNLLVVGGLVLLTIGLVKAVGYILAGIILLFLAVFIELA